jgi:H+-transporting ATPase
MIDERKTTSSIPPTEPGGLSQAEAKRRLEKFGPNAIPEEHPKRWLIFLKKMWAPVPWMLETSIVLELILGKTIEALIIGLLVIFNAFISTLQESRAQSALALLRKRLTVTSRVLRDGKWSSIPSSELVPDDVVYLRMGDLVPADIHLLSGQIQVDRSTLTGESLPVDAGTDQDVYAGTTVKRGEASGLVTATGMRTKFGKTADLVRLAKVTGQLERIVFTIAKNLVILDAILVVLVLGYSVLSALPLADILPFALILLVASVPVALPATFTVATALGAVDLSKHGVLVTRLGAIEEAASMEVLCTDKTGTLTENHLEVAGVIPISPYTTEGLIRYAAMASDEATQDPLDMAILSRAEAEHISVPGLNQRKRFIPFEPATKRSEAVYQLAGKTISVLKGAPQVIKAFDPSLDGTYDAQVTQLATQGNRVLAVAVRNDQQLRVVGLLGLQDPPRSDAKSLIQRLKELGVRVIMLTGDGKQTALAIAEQVGIGDQACDTAIIQKNSLDSCDVYAEVLPENKFALVKAFQKQGKIVGMTGDGVNDAPALKQAEVGIAVANATDVAKAAASLVLTSPGLSNLVSAIETSRQIYQRMLTYTLNKIIKTIEIAFFLSFGLIFAHTFVTTPLLMVLLLFTNDFVTMSLATDRVVASPLPNRWNVRTIVLAATLIALPILALSFTIFGYASAVLHLPLPQLQTLLFVMLVYSGQGMIYLVRERRAFWSSRPSKWMLIGTLTDVVVVALLATQGILMTPIPAVLVGELLAIIVVFLILLDVAKIRIFDWLQLK